MMNSSKTNFPLTPTLSRGGRGHHATIWRCRTRFRQILRSRLRMDGGRFSLSLRERAGMRGNGNDLRQKKSS